MKPQPFNPFLRSLMIHSNDLAQIGTDLPIVRGKGAANGIVLEYGVLAETLLLRRQIDRFLGAAAERDAITSLLLTIVTTGHLFGYNRAFLLIKGEADGWIRAAAGVGALSREEAWEQWSKIHREGLDFEDVMVRAARDLEAQHQRLSPLIERLVLSPEDESDTAAAMCGAAPAVLSRDAVSDSGRWLLDVLGAGQAGIVPMWGQWGFFGDLIVDNFATERPIILPELMALSDFIKPFLAALEKTLIIERYRSKVHELEEANTRIDTQREMLVKMERRASLGRYTSTRAHNLRNPLVSMAGRVGQLRDSLDDRGRLEAILADLQGDLRGLEEFIGDFISLVETEHPGRHFWDLNHLIGEVARSFAIHDPIEPPQFTVEEGPLPLVQFEYDVLFDVLVRLVGLLAAGKGAGPRVHITTLLVPSQVRVSVDVTDRDGNAAAVEDRARREIEKLSQFLTREEMGLSTTETGAVLTIPT